MSKIREHANGQSCIRCGTQDETVVLCHYSGSWQHRFGKGRGIKGNDLAGAEFCAVCHRYFDEYQSIPSAGSFFEIEVATLSRSDEFLAMCILTTIRRQA